MRVRYLTILCFILFLASCSNDYSVLGKWAVDKEDAELGRYVSFEKSIAIRSYGKNNSYMREVKYYQLEQKDAWRVDIKTKDNDYEPWYIIKFIDKDTVQATRLDRGGNVAHYKRM